MHDRKKLIDALIAAGMTEEEAERALVLPEDDPSAPPDGGAAPLRGEPEPGVSEPDEPKPDEPEPGEPSEPTPDEPEPNEPEPNEPEPDEPSEPTPDEPEPNEPEPSEPIPDLAAENAKLRESLLAALLRSGGLTAGVKPDRLDALVKLADVSAVDPLADDAAEQVNAAVAAALEMVPELAPANPAAAIPGALGQHPRNTSKPLSAFERGLLG